MNDRPITILYNNNATTSGFLAYLEIDVWTHMRSMGGWGSPEKDGGSTENANHTTVNSR